MDGGEKRDESCNTYTRMVYIYGYIYINLSYARARDTHIRYTQDRAKVEEWDSTRPKNDVTIFG